MKKTIRGELGKLVRLVVAVITEDIYSVPLMEQFQKPRGRSFTINTVYTTLFRLEEKGFLSSSVGEANTERGGRKACLP